MKNHTNVACVTKLSHSTYRKLSIEKMIQRHILTHNLEKKHPKQCNLCEKAYHSKSLL